MLLITGANGQLGRALLKLLPDSLALSSFQLDITDLNAVRECIEKYDICTIINCAAYTKVDLAESQAEKAWLVNHAGVVNLGCTGARVVHVSTDFVFDGDINRAYVESDLTNPQSVYGKSKLAGEKELLEISPNSIVIRTSWLYSKLGNNFYTTMIKLGKKNSEIKVVDDQYGSPTNANDLAFVIASVINNKDACGLYHYSNNGVCSWAEFAQRIMQHAKLDCKVLPISTEEYSAVAKRPKFSPLDSSKICDLLDIKNHFWFDRLGF